MMIQIDDKIVSTDLFDVRFCCDLAACRGICCVEGDSGAPLEEEEVETLEFEYEAFRPYMKPEGIRTVEAQGFMVIDRDGDFTTPLIDGSECAYAAATEDGIPRCAIEKAFLEGKTGFRKPISCHLYPIRVARFGNGTTGLNFHRWEVCRPALELGEKRGTPLYRMLKEPLVRRFGAPFYNMLEKTALLLEKEHENL